MRSKLQIALLSLLLGFATWYLVAFEEKVESSSEVRLEYFGQPQTLTVRKGLVDKIGVRVRGPRSLVRALDATRLGYPVDLSALRPGENVIGLSAGRVPILPPLEVVDLTPQQLTVVAEELLEKSVAVEPVLGGRLDESWRLKEARITPAEVLLRGPRSLVARVERLPTREIPLGSATPALYEGTVALAVPEGLEARPAQADVQLVFGPRTTELWLAVPVQVRGPLPPRAALVTKEVNLRLAVPQKLADKARRDELRQALTVDVELPPGLKAGRNELELRVETPEHVEVLEMKPSRATVEIGG